MNIEIKPLSPHIGCEIIGLNLERELTGAERDDVMALWIKHGVLVVRNGGSSPEAQLRFSRLFGTLEPHPVRELHVQGNADLISLTYDAQDPKKNSWPINEVNGELRAGYLYWHWDTAQMPVTCRGAVLRPIRLPKAGGLTGFIDRIQAYDRLPEALKQQIEKLEVVYQMEINPALHKFGRPEQIRTIKTTPLQESIRARMKTDYPAVVHPMVFVQSETGRKVLNFCPPHARYVLGMDPQESDALLHEIARYATDERYAYYHHWKPNDLLAWDNWRVLHIAMGVSPDDTREMQRTTIMGDYGLGRYLDPARDKSMMTARYVE
ncbi:TauD/TfdA dioxygenase family protein [Noviherbaspirillum sedimenti]|uniref:TauD/TfdA family dioxygenase n=1 Tax=Noviherbaspirillum sedimenti TaxID=2320865 RepID=A0A3A3G137_9BURK|nr:TauD/TfdA family dioxygenase [Noviherbaspirillum sedimenti]RJG00619.1 TauD/TfdA family dioxygenase [Noviherbaspirillum sedimenti]